MNLRAPYASVLVALSISLSLLTSACSSQESSSSRRQRDEQIGIMENEQFRFAADGGLLHVTGSSDTSLTVRASAPEFTARLTRKDATVSSIDLQIANMPNNPSLKISGIDAVGTVVPGAAHTYSWTVTFTSDEVSIEAPERTKQNFRFLAFGDIQGGVDRFADMVDAVNQESSAEFILMLGDLTSRSKPEEFDEVARHYARIQIPVYTTPGNHDVMRPREYQDRYGRANYSFTYRGMRFTSIDSSAAELEAGAWDWAESWMKQGASTGHVIFSHIPAAEYSGVRSGQWSSRREANKFLAMARANAVDLFLFGHIHSHYSYQLAGISTHISGGCGAIEERLDGIDRHYLKIDVDASTGALTTEPARIE